MAEMGPRTWDVWLAVARVLLVPILSISKALQVSLGNLQNEKGAAAAAWGGCAAAGKCGLCCTPGPEAPDASGPGRSSPATALRRRSSASPTNSLALLPFPRAAHTLTQPHTSKGKHAGILTRLLAPPT